MLYRGHGGRVDRTAGIRHMEPLEEQMKKYDMLKDSPGKSLFFFALPMILGNLFQQFYNMVDSVIVGQFVGEDALAAVGASYSLTTVFIMIAIGGGIGASVITSQYLGAREYGKMKTSVYTALISFAAVSVVLGLFGFGMCGRILMALRTPENILGDAVLYLRIYFLGLPFLFMYNILSSVFNALGDSRTPLYLLIFSSVLNVFLDLWMVLAFELGVAGVALATITAQGLSAVISFLLLIRTLKGYQTGKEEDSIESMKISRYSLDMLGSMVKIAIPSMIQQSIVSIGMLLVQSGKWIRLICSCRIYFRYEDRVHMYCTNDCHGKCGFYVYRPEPGSRRCTAGEKRLFFGICYYFWVCSGDFAHSQPVSRRYYFGVY